MDMVSWEGYSGADKRALGGLYVPYLVFGEFFLLVFVFGRLG